MSSILTSLQQLCFVHRNQTEQFLQFVPGQLASFPDPLLALGNHTEAVIEGVGDAFGGRDCVNLESIILDV